MSLKKRQENVKGVFDIRYRYRFNFKEILKDKSILFVDDLCTTGATLKNVARLIVDAQPKELTAAVACRVV